MFSEKPTWSWKLPSDHAILSSSFAAGKQKACSIFIAEVTALLALDKGQRWLNLIRKVCSADAESGSQSSCKIMHAEMFMVTREIFVC